MEAINARLVALWGEWNGADDRKKADFLAYQVLPLGEERDALARKLLDDPASAGFALLSSPSGLQAVRELSDMRDYFPARLADAETRLRGLLDAPWPQDFSSARRHYAQDVQPWSDYRRAVIDFLRARGLPCAADPKPHPAPAALYAKYGRYPLFLAFLRDVFRGGNAAACRSSRASALSPCARCCRAKATSRVRASTF